MKNQKTSIIVKEKYSEQTFNVTIEKNKSITINCVYKNRMNPVETTVTLNIGDSAEHSSYNMSYYGHIQKITEKTVTIGDSMSGIIVE